MPDGYYMLNGIYTYDGVKDVMHWSFWAEKDKSHALTEAFLKILEMAGGGVEFDEIRLDYIDLGERDGKER